MNRSMNRRAIRALLFSIRCAIAFVDGSFARAELVRAQLEGVVNSSAIAAQEGETWSLSLIFDTSAPEVPFTAEHPNFAEFFNTSGVKVLRSLDFRVGLSSDFTIHLVDPVASLDSDVRIDIDNFDSKTFFAHVNDAALLPAWNGLQLDNFVLELEDLLPGGYFDGTDHLPAPDPAITISEFTGFNQVRFQLGSAGSFFGTPTSFALVSVPEPSAGCLVAISGLTLLLLRSGRSQGSRVIEGLSSDRSRGSVAYNGRRSRRSVAAMGRKYSASSTPIWNQNGSVRSDSGTNEYTLYPLHFLCRGIHRMCDA
jgi:hypothetical protein